MLDVALLIIRIPILSWIVHWGGSFEPTGTVCCYRWLGLVGQFRPKKLMANIKDEVVTALGGEELQIPSFKNISKHVLDKSLYALALCTHIPITSSSSLFLSSEAHGERKGRRNKLLLFHKASL